MSPPDPAAVANAHSQAGRAVVWVLMAVPDMTADQVAYVAAHTVAAGLAAAGVAVGQPGRFAAAALAALGPVHAWHGPAADLMTRAAWDAVRRWVDREWPAVREVAAKLPPGDPVPGVAAAHAAARAAVRRWKSRWN